MINVTTCGREYDLLNDSIDGCIKWIREVDNEVNARSNAGSILKEYHTKKMNQMNFVERFLFLFN